MSSSSTKDTTSQSATDKAKSSEDPKKQLAAEKKKLKVLKNALKDERAQREQVELELKQTNEKIEVLKGQLAEKDQKYMQLYDENMKLQEALIRESKAAGLQAQSAPKGIIGNLINLTMKTAEKTEANKQPATTTEEQQPAPVVDNALVAMCKAQEETILKKDDEIIKL